MPPPKATIRPVQDKDIPTLFQIFSLSFAHDAAFVDIYFPNHDTLQGQIDGSARLLEWKQSSGEHTTFLKAVISSSSSNDDEEGETIIGLGVWTLMKEPPSTDISVYEDMEKIYPDLDDREFMTRLWADYVVPRGRVVREAGGKGVWVLELLCVHPSHHRHGAGTSLTKWGINKAQEMNLEAIVEATPIGRRTYKKCGFKVEIEEMDFSYVDRGDGIERFRGREKPVLLFMRTGVLGREGLKS